MPGEIIAGGMVITTDYTLTAKSEDFGDLLYGSQINVNGVPFTVREATLQGDGKMVQLSIQRSVATEGVTSATALDSNGADLSIDDLSNEQLNPDLDGGAATTSYLEGNLIDGGGA